jgi:hypothetical protein
LGSPVSGRAFLAARLRADFFGRAAGISLLCTGNGYFTLFCHYLESSEMRATNPTSAEEPTSNRRRTFPSKAHTRRSKIRTERRNFFAISFANGNFFRSALWKALSSKHPPGHPSVFGATSVPLEEDFAHKALSL